MKASSEEMAIFVAVVESGSFSRAAEQLGIANSAVSRSIKKLENKFNISLLNRTTRQLSLTREGERYFRRAQTILQEMAAAESELLESKHVPVGNLSIDAATPVLLYLLNPIIAKFRQRYPQINLSLISSETFINLIERKTDIAIRAGTLSDSTLRARPLLTSYRRIVATPAYLARCGIPRTIEDLSQHCCLGFTEPASLNLWPLNITDGELLPITASMSSNSGEVIKQLCLQDNGIACLSDFMVDDEIARGELVVLLADSTQPVGMPVSAVFYSDNAVSHRIRAFIDFISSELATDRRSTDISPSQVPDLPGSPAGSLTPAP